MPSLTWAEFDLSRFSCAEMFGTGGHAPLALYLKGDFNERFEFFKKIINGLKFLTKKLSKLFQF